ncbi:hypothetical protein B0H63DRAFT_487973 [Podospora didyma]|uniref:Transposase n=1 Tax=Podospora didyma TaxID=330526 RepID=A0AAE0K2F7_9PEZI|nr:hypothetical protein B0H63DRAFT_487973 [Podospora didyma]
MDRIVYYHIYVMASQGPANVQLGNPTTPIKTRPKAPELTRDERIGVQTLRNLAGLTYLEIARRTGYTYRRVQRACAGPLTPQKARKRKGWITTPEKARLKDWLEAERRQSPKLPPMCQMRNHLPEHIGLSSYGERALARAVRDLGYHRSQPCGPKAPMLSVPSTQSQGDVKCNMKRGACPAEHPEPVSYHVEPPLSPLDNKRVVDLFQIPATPLRMFCPQ